MTDLFISYSRQDRHVADRLAAALETLGWSVWWDRRIGAGQAFDRTIEQAIDKARLVVVIWSRHSVDSDWVRAEAAYALHAAKLLPVSIDQATLPLRFTHTQTLKLIDWDGSADAPGLRQLAAEIADLLGASTAGAATATNSPAGFVARVDAVEHAARKKRRSKGSIALAAVAAIGLIWAGAVTYLTTSTTRVTPAGNQADAGRPQRSTPASAAPPSVAAPGGAGILPTDRHDAPPAGAAPPPAPSDATSNPPAAAPRQPDHAQQANLAPPAKQQPMLASAPAAVPSVIGEPIVFGDGGVALSEAARTMIDQQSLFLREHPTITVTIEAYSSKREGPALAELRALQVRHALVDRGVDGSRISIGTHAGPQPAAAGAESPDRRAVIMRN